MPFKLMSLLAGIRNKARQLLRTLFRRPGHTSSTSLPRPSSRIDPWELLKSLDISPRVKAHHELKKLLLQNAPAEEIAAYALGNLYEHSNYCAQVDRDQGNSLAKEIQENNPQWIRQVAGLTRDLFQINAPPPLAPDAFLKVLRRYDIDYLKISIASEISMILHPHLFTVLNKRTMFAYFKIQQGLKQGQRKGSVPANFPNDQELLAEIIRKYDEWENHLAATTKDLQQFFQHALMEFFPYPQYAFFYTEAISSQLYRQARDHGGSLCWTSFCSQILSLPRSVFPLPGPPDLNG